MTLGDALSSERSQNLNLLRFLLAAGVIVSHAWPLALGPGTPEPLENLTGHSLGGWAIGVFFFISGVLISASAERKSPGRFWAARTRRILPGLGAALLVTFALAQASGSTAGMQEAVIWFIRAFTLVSIEHRLTDAFAANPYAGVVNGPLWSLFYEVLAYALCAAFVWMGAVRNMATGLLLSALAFAICLIQIEMPDRLVIFAPLFASFSLGMVAYIWRHRIALNMTTVVLALLLASCLPGSLNLGAVGLAVVVAVMIAPVVRLKNDVSYGMYIYGWPIAQTLVAMLPGIAPLPLAMLSVVATYPVALMSWHIIERPGLPKRWATA